MGAYSKLHDLTYQKLKKNFPEFIIRENIRPDWLVSSKNTKLELDLFIEQLNTAIEIQGRQHYQFTPRFHKTYNDFKEQKRRDQEKRDLCYGHGVRLVEIAMALDLDLFIKELLRGKEPEIMQLPLDEQRKLEKIKKKSEPRQSMMRFRRVRKWMKRKELIRRGLLPPSRAYKEKLPGSHRQRNRARNLLKCLEIGNEQWLVWGGNAEHKLDKESGILSCDCMQYSKYNLCSHTIKVMIENGSFPKPELVKI